MSQSNDELIDEVHDGIARVTLNRPQARNALTFEMYERLSEICRSMPTDGSVKAMIITGSGEKAFAAGTDISKFLDFNTPEQGLDYEASADGHFAAVEACPVPTIAAIAGACTGGGAGIAACCDLRIATADMKFGFPMARTLGNVLSVATLARLVALVGEPRVRDMMITSRLLGADEALRIGLVNEVVPDHAALMARVEELAATLAQHAPLTMRATKELLLRLREQGAKADDRDWVGRIYASADFKEGREAFLAKRKPQWTGR